MPVATFTKAGTKSQTPAKLSKAVFGDVPKNHDLLKVAYLSYLANGRQGGATVKTRGLVSGGGRKPWRQKGTGRARVGSIRSPIWRGGGVIFGPTGQENHQLKLHKNAKRQAIRQALSLKAQENAIRIVEDIDVKEGTVRPIVKLLQKIEAKGRVLIVVGAKDALAERATRNLENVNAVQAKYLNVFDILNADTLVISNKSLELLEQWLTVSAKKGVKP